MKYRLIKKISTFIIATTTILSVSSIGASAEWKQDSIGWWNTEGSSWLVGWKQIDGKWYYFGQDGYMVHDTTVNGYRLGSDGVWVQNTNVNSNNTTNTNSNNTVNANTTNNVNSNNTTNLTTNINNGIIINGNVNIGNTTNVNNTNSNNLLTNQQDSSNSTAKNYDGKDGFVKISDDKYVYYEDGQMLKNTWKKFDEGYRHFGKSGYLDINTGVDGLSVDEKGLIPLTNKFPYTQKDIFMNIKPYYQSTLGYAGDLNYIKNTFDVFNIKYSIEFKDVYNSEQDGALIQISNKYQKHFSEMDDMDFKGEKIITIGKYKDRLGLDR